MLGCMCDSDECNRKQPYKMPKGTVTCHQTHGVLTDDSLQESTCQGMYCMVMRGKDVTLPGEQYRLGFVTNVVEFVLCRYTKGCVTVSDPRLLKTGYRNIIGVEQYFCDQDLCNRYVLSLGEFGFLEL